MNDDRSPLATVEQVAEHLGVSVKTLYQWRLNGTGPAGFRVGKFLRYRWTDVDAWVRSQAAVSA